VILEVCTALRQRGDPLDSILCALRTSVRANLSITDRCRLAGRVRLRSGNDASGSCPTRPKAGLSGGGSPFVGLPPHAVD